MRKLDHCRCVMIGWKRRNVTNAMVRINEIRGLIDQAMCGSSVSSDHINLLSCELNKAYADDEEYRRLKSRNRWLNLGDRNTDFYHGVARMKKNQNKIKHMQDKHGTLHSQDEMIDKIAEEIFFRDVFFFGDKSIIRFFS